MSDFVGPNRGFVLTMYTNFAYTVCVRCLTYNQESYIQDAMNGFTMQETDFPYVVTIVDDASTDKEPQIIRDFFSENFRTQDSDVAFRELTDYGEVLFAQHKINKNCFFAILFLKQNHYSQKISKMPYLSRWVDKSKYIAMCEGDDYWTDSRKLQAQVSFLEGHEEYSLCCHRYRIYNQSSDTWNDDYTKRLFENHLGGFSFTRSDNLKTWITKTVTTMYRREWIVMEELQKYKYRCDEHLNYHLLSHGPGYCLPFFGAVYRRTESGVFAPLPEKNKRMRGVLIRSELLAYNIDDDDLRENVFGRLKKYLFQYGSLSRMKDSIRVCLRSYYMADGLKACLSVSKKLMGAYYKGLFNRGHAK